MFYVLVGSEFWKKVSAEHGIGADGFLVNGSTSSDDRKDVFFYQVIIGYYRFIVFWIFIPISIGLLGRWWTIHSSFITSGSRTKSKWFCFFDFVIVYWK